MDTPVVDAPDLYTERLPDWCWRIPPDERRDSLSAAGIELYVECELPLERHYDAWIWLHNLVTWDEVMDRLSHEVDTYLAFFELA